jgi:glycosyltransferase involved in cell wall biosynthesis
MEGRMIISSYFCDPYSVSEAQSAFKWMEILIKEYKVILFTTKQYEQNINDYFKDNLPENLKIIGIRDTFPFRDLLHKNQLYIGYFIFMLQEYFYLRRNRNEFRDVKVVFHRNPCSFRYYTLLHRINIALVIGPVSGGLKPPRETKTFFKNERFFNRLRTFDEILLKFPVYRKQYAKADKVLVTSEYIYSIIPYIKKSKSQIILETAVNCPEYENTSSTGNPKPIIHILFVGRLVKYKGTELVLIALNKLMQRNYVLHIIGDGPERKRLENLTNVLNLTDNVVFHGHQESKNVSQFYRQADIFCFPTLKEAAGTVLLEAMAHALPIITVNFGGPKDICPDSGTFKITVASVEEMTNEIAHRLNQLISDETLRSTMGKENYKHCVRNFTWDALEKRILDIFKPYFTVN